MPAITGVSVTRCKYHNFYIYELYKLSLVSVLMNYCEAPPTLLVFLNAMTSVTVS